MQTLAGMKIIANKETVLETLEANRKKHKKVVQEARKGYLVKAEAALTKRLKEVIGAAKKGRLVHLQFNLHPPQDYTAEYDTAIKAVSLHLDKSIELTSEQVRSLLMDKWDWTSHFYMSNSAYSETAAMLVEGNKDEEI